MKAAQTIGGVFLVLVLMHGCSDTEVEPTPPDAAVAPDGSKLYSCKTPGQACNAHDACALNATCGEDKLCHPGTLQNCDDGLDCTTDTCEGSGLCGHAAKEGFCALAVKEGGKSVIKCYSANDTNPTDFCEQCDPTISTDQWTGANGGSCDDGNDCTREDYCQAGECKGTYYAPECSDELECTEDACDGKGGCSNPLKKGWCRIDGACYEGGATDLSECFYCNPNQSQTAWTAIDDVCKIGATCKANGTKDATGCGICDPQANANDWTPTANSCLIEGVCLQTGEKSSNGCGECDPNNSNVSYSPVANKCLIWDTCYDEGTISSSGCGSCQSVSQNTWWTDLPAATSNTTGFESGMEGWVADPLSDSLGWQLSTVRAYAGSGSLYYGHPTNKSYDANGSANSGSVSSGTISLPAGQKAALHLWLYLDIESTAKFDVLSIEANSTAIWTKSPATMPLSNYKRWIPLEVDLSAFAGSDIILTLKMDTIDGWANTGEGIYLDAVTVLTNCAVL
jgi:hypothetical protein